MLHCLNPLLRYISAEARSQNDQQTQKDQQRHGQKTLVVLAPRLHQNVPENAGIIKQTLFLTIKKIKAPFLKKSKLPQQL